MDAYCDAIMDWIHRIRDILNIQWDPISAGQPADEYDQYANRLASMLASGASDTDLLAYFKWAEIENMGLGGPFNPDSLKSVIASLRALDIPIK